MRRSISWPVCLALAVLVCGYTTADQGVLLEVTGGREAVSDWVAQATVDLAAARSILGWAGRPDQIVIRELDASGDTGAPVAAQVDPSEGKGVYTVTWRVPGELAGGATRRFLLSFGTAGEADNGTAVNVQDNGKTVIVTNGPRQFQYERSMGGMIYRIALGNASAVFTWNDKIYDGTIYCLANHNAKEMKVTATGPLRSRIEATDTYLDNGKAPESKPRATYRFTTYAGLPFTRVDAVVTQDFAHQWRSLHFIEMQLGKAGFTHLATEKDREALAQKGKMYSGSPWAAVYNQKLLVATCACAKPGVYDGGGQHYGEYLRGATVPMNGLEYLFNGAIVVLDGSRALKDKEVQRWNAILSDPPAVRIRLQTLEERLSAVKKSLDEKRLNVETLSGKAWAVEHVAVTLAGSKEAAAREALSSGSFRAAADAIEACEEALYAKTDSDDLNDANDLLAGTVMGHPFLANGNVAYLWAPANKGCGLISIFDREAKHEFLRAVSSTDAPLWEMALKTPEGGTTRRSAGTPCEVTFNMNDTDGRAAFKWSADGIKVEVTSRLVSGEAFLRSRINAATDGAYGLTAVTFPLVAGIAPLSPGGTDDEVLDTQAMGKAVTSPLASGKTVSIEYPDGMQFTALLGDGRGLYFAEEDGQANRKTIAWTPDAATGALTFSIAHPVLNWGAKTLVKDYQCPGDFVWGPFQGDWYDVARLYRQWALTAPWCAKGPLQARDDYPKWLLNAPYWTIASLGDEDGIEREIEKQAFYNIPTMIAHTYGYFFMPHMDDRYPEHWPPKLGSEGFKQAVKTLQEKGIRIVPYVNGWVWDADTVSFRLEEGADKAALWGGNGQLSKMMGYGGGQTFVGMCPASKLWREKMLSMVRELVGRYGVDGVYFDFLTIHTNDCFNPAHGHAMGGGDYWTKGVHGLYEECRALAKELNPDAMITGEDIAEYCIDVQGHVPDLGKSGDERTAISGRVSRVCERVRRAAG